MRAEAGGPKAEAPRKVKVGRGLGSGKLCGCPSVTVSGEWNRGGGQWGTGATVMTVRDTRDPLGPWPRPIATQFYSRGGSSEKASNRP